MGQQDGSCVKQNAEGRGRGEVWGRIDLHGGHPWVVPGLDDAGVDQLGELTLGEHGVDEAQPGVVPHGHMRQPRPHLRGHCLLANSLNCKIEVENLGHPWFGVPLIHDSGTLQDMSWKKKLEDMHRRRSHCTERAESLREMDLGLVALGHMS